MEPGEKAICQHDDWWNAYGDKSLALHCGMRVTVKAGRYVGGTHFTEFEEVPNNWYMTEGFRPMRSLN